MRSITTFFFALSLSLILAACATVQPPQPDPLQEQLSIMRKQLLELQVLQNDTRAKLDEKTGVIDTLAIKLNTLEEKLQVLSKVQGNAKSATTTRNAQINKNSKKKKQVRRQE
jgi:hypothetical protein